LQQLNWLGCSQGQRAAGRFHVGHSGLGTEWEPPALAGAIQGWDLLGCGRLDLGQL